MSGTGLGVWPGPVMHCFEHVGTPESCVRCHQRIRLVPVCSDRGGTPLRGVRYGCIRGFAAISLVGFRGGASHASERRATKRPATKRPATKRNRGFGEGAEEGGGGAAFFDEVGGVEGFAEGGEGVGPEGLDAEAGDLEVGAAPGLDVLGRGPGGELGEVAAGAAREFVDVEADLGEEVEEVVIGGGKAGKGLRKAHLRPR